MGGKLFVTLTFVVPLHLRVGGDHGAYEAGLGFVALVIGFLVRCHCDKQRLYAMLDLLTELGKSTNWMVLS